MPKIQTFSVKNVINIIQGGWKYCNGKRQKSRCNISHGVAVFLTALQYFPYEKKNQTNQKLYEFSVKADSLKGVVDKILQSVANFHGHF